MSSRSGPPGWPEQVRPPGAEAWERSAVAWLLDLCPADYRAYEVLRRHPLALARFAQHCVSAGVVASRHGLSTVRDELRGLIPTEAVEATVRAYEIEGARLVKVGREVELVTQALAGQTFRSKL